MRGAEAARRGSVARHKQRTYHQDDVLDLKAGIRKPSQDVYQSRGNTGLQLPCTSLKRASSEVGPLAVASLWAAPSSGFSVSGLFTPFFSKIYSFLSCFSSICVIVSFPEIYMLTSNVDENILQYISEYFLMLTVNLSY